MSSNAQTVSRPLEIAAFLDRHGWAEAQNEALSGDFSTRRYARLTKESGNTAFLMDADENQKTPRFVALAHALRDIGIRAPEIYAEESENGLVLMEDFGTRNVGTLLDKKEDPRPYFLRAAEVLANLHRNFKPSQTAALGLPLFDSGLFTTQAELFLDAYFPVVMARDASDEERNEFRAAWQAVLRPLDQMPRSLLLRDYMPDNLMDLPDGSLGVLDFHYAGIGPTAYDLASLCEEVRRDGSFDLLPDVIDHYREVSGTQLSQAELMRTSRILSAQRHTRILGIVARLSHNIGHCDKFAYLPRIRLHLEKLLMEPYLVPVRVWIETYDRLLQ